jgi:hypothetical protein
MKMKLFFTAISLGIAITVSGCVGVGVVTSANPRVWDVSDKDNSGVCPTQFSNVRDNSTINAVASCPKADLQKVTPEKLIKMWGRPDSDKTAEGYRTIGYDQELTWRGIVVFAIIPVPLLVPLGQNEDTFIFKGDDLVHYEHPNNLFYARLCGFRLNGNAQFSASPFCSLWPDELKEEDLKK